MIKINHVSASLLITAIIGTALSIGCGTQNPERNSATPLMASQALSQQSQCSEVATLAAGTYHTVGLKKDGTVVAVGNNSHGQLNVSSWTRIRAIAAGTYHTVGLKTDGTVVATGYNGYGQLGVSAWTNIKAIAAGTYHTVGLKEDGTVVAVGNNSYGQLNTSAWTNIKAIAAGAYHTVGLKEDGTVVASGQNGYGQLDVTSWSSIKAIASGAYHTIGLKEDGTIAAIGYNSNGQLNVSAWTDIKSIAAGTYHTVGLKNDGTVAATGNNSYNQLNVSSWINIKAIAAGTYHTVGLKNDGTVVAIGYNGYGQLNVSPLFSDIMPICDSACDSAQDVTPPFTTIGLTGTPGENGWYISDVQMSLTATDNVDGSGVKEIHYTIDGTEATVEGNTVSYSIVGEGTHMVTWYAIDNASNEETPHQEISIMVDKTPPTITATLSPLPNAQGWNNTDVTVTFTCSDNTSGIATCPNPVKVTTEGAGQSIIDTAIDKAGNSAKVAVTVNIDKTPPSVASLSANPSILWPPNHKMVSVLLGSIADGESGIDSSVVTVSDEYGTGNLTLSGLGNAIPLESWRDGTDLDGRVYTITAVVTDRAGNSSTGTTTVLVPHDMR